MAIFMDEEIKVSIIIPVYNVEQYLRECLDSIINQTLREIEIICINDGSTDGSSDILNEYLKSDDRVRVITQENKGQSAARNTGVEIAKGKYINFIDSDDLLKTDALRELYELAESNRAEVVYFDSDVIYESEEIAEKHKNFTKTYYVRGNDYHKVTDGAALFVAMMKNEEFRCQVCMQFSKTNYLKANGIRFYEGIIHEDELFAFQCLLSANRVLHVKKPYYVRRIRANSVMTKTKGFSNFYGYFVCFYHMLLFSSQREYSGDAKEQILVRIDGVRRHAVAIYEKNGKPESWINSLSVTEQYLAKQFILQPSDNIASTEQAYRKEEGMIKKVKKILKKLLPMPAASQNAGFIDIRQKLSVLDAGINDLAKTLSTLNNKIDNIQDTVKDELMQNRNIVNNIMHEQVRRLKTASDKPETNPKVSVIVPVYNAEPYLRQCIDSLRLQTLYDFELICIDDGSTDNSGSIIDAYKTLDSRIKVIHKENTNAGESRNLGIDIATGDYIVFLDSDDFFEPTLLQRQYETCVLYNADISICAASTYDESSGKTIDSPWILDIKNIPSNNPFSRRDCPNRIFQTVTPSPWSKMFKRSFIEKADLRFQSIKRCNDLYFIYSAMALADKIAVCNETLLSYRTKVPNSLQTSISLSPMEFYAALSLLQQRLKDENIYDDLEQSFANMALTCVMNNIDKQSSPEAAEEIITAFFNEYIYKYDIDGKPEECFNQYRFKQYEKLKESRKSV
ncbi:MAG: glycosyltransferase [Oscillospiraceae bacterium]|jgi:glycosyltransferase involved in cell wall biosynthesis|nr:glycosyltransferase [Oscillospiraceae bacterium]